MLSPVLVPDIVASPAIVSVLFASFNVMVKVFELTVKFSVLASTRSNAPVPVERMPKDVSASAVPPLISGVVKTGLARVPTLVNEEDTTVALRVVPLKVPAAAVTVMLPVPSKEVPFMVLAVCNAIAVLALPVKAPIKSVEVIEVAPVTTPASMTIVPSRTICCPVNGVIVKSTPAVEDMSFPLIVMLSI